MGISTRKLMMYTIDDLMYCAKNKCIMMLIAARSNHNPSSGLKISSEVAVIVNINAEINLNSV
jgi:hypothetical protein